MFMFALTTIDYVYMNLFSQGSWNVLIAWVNVGDELIHQVEKTVDKIVHCTEIKNDMELLL